MDQFPKDEPGIFDGYQDTQREVLDMELRKTRNKLFSIAIAFFVFDLISLISIDVFTLQLLLYICIIPAIMIAFAFLSMKEPMLAMILALVVVLALWIYMISVLGARGAITGWLAKAVVIYLLIAGFQSAREAQKIKRELKA